MVEGDRREGVTIAALPLRFRNNCCDTSVVLQGKQVRQGVDSGLRGPPGTCHPRPGSKSRSRQGVVAPPEGALAEEMGRRATAQRPLQGRRSLEDAGLRPRDDWSVR